MLEKPHLYAFGGIALRLRIYTARLRFCRPDGDGAD
jgi:hypothetical protein